MYLFDEKTIRERLAVVGKRERTLFAVASAERLFPLFGRYAAIVKTDEQAVLRRSLDLVWEVVGGHDLDLNISRASAERLVPSDEGEWRFEMGYGQNAAAGVAYAARSWLNDDPREPVWAALQVYEAADYAAQRSLSSSEAVGPDEAILLAHPIVQDALRSIDDDLAAVESFDGDWSTLRFRAAELGSKWAAGWP